MLNPWIVSGDESAMSLLVGRVMREAREKKKKSKRSRESRCGSQDTLTTRWLGGATT